MPGHDGPSLMTVQGGNGYPSLHKISTMPVFMMAMMANIWSLLPAYETIAGEPCLAGMELFHGEGEMSWAAVDRGLPWMWFDKRVQHEWGTEELKTIY